MANKVIIGYWDNSRGFLEPIKLALEYAGVPYEQRNPKYGPAPFYDNVEWMQNKAQILEGYDFPNLPFYQDDEFKLTQWKAIMAYLGRKHNIMPEKTDEKTLTDMDMLRDVAADLVSAETGYLYDMQTRMKGTEPSDEQKSEKRKAFQTSIKRHLKPLNEKKGKAAGKFFLGDKLTYIDIILFTFVDNVRILEGEEFFQEFPNLLEFLKNVDAVPAIKAYRESDRYQKYPVFTFKACVGRQEGDIPNI